ncbi:MAG: T9SS type A sorting domain-containing protein [Ignavibacteria bacterium]|nr:T9SS type A sorting domain-containing protein [Ignavibacteria bacterium]
MKTLFILIVIILSTFLVDINAQSILNGFDCQLLTNPYANSEVGTPFQGVYKPNRTDLSGGLPSPADAYFPILVVFVQFKDEGTDPRNTWPINSAPIYLNSMIATYKNDNGNWWNFYNPQTQAISSHWMEISRGKFHTISPNGAFSVVLPKTPLEYWLASGQNHTVAERMVHQDIWNSVRQQGLTDWRPYDRWKKVGSNFYFCNIGDGDGYVDMIYKVMKSRGQFSYNDTIRTIMANYDGYARLGWSYLGTDVVDSVNNIIVDYNYSENGSGITVSFRSVKEQYIQTMGHEYLHNTVYISAHITYSRCNYGIGFDFFYSPYDMIVNEYMFPKDAQIGEVNYLGDYSSRNNDSLGELLKLPIQNTQNRDEFFLIANRRKVSIWDRPMAGDTSVVNPYSNNSEYGKGIYIYHIKNGIYRPGWGNHSPQDMECADGFWEWEHSGYTYARDIPDCYQTPNSDWPFLKKKNPLYINDASPLANQNPYGDGLSFSYRGYNPNKSLVKWWGVGENTLDYCDIGIDRTHTNCEDIYTNMENRGDRYDAWNLEYNVIFSPYSSPNTMNWDNDTTGIFIWYRELNSNTATLVIEKAEEYGGNKPLAEILAETPPSRPMGIKIDITDCIDQRMYPVIMWNHNMEPDMVHYIGENEYKTYRIYRAWTDINSVPDEYSEIAAVNIPANESPYFIDYYVYALCEEGPGTLNNRLRYKIRAVDIFNDSSVYSDFVSIPTYYVQREKGYGGDVVKSGLPKEYSISQNYPNPFNPVTKINFALPKQGFVTIKIYDVLGREVRTLVNEVKTPGNYIVEFNANELASGVYFYKIEVNGFSDVKRMILIK